jgi:predicted protein tyrosine phosphatase
MILVCPFSRLHDIVAETGARHVITLIDAGTRVARPTSIAADDHLDLRMDDILEPIPGLIHPSEEHVDSLIRFLDRWDRQTPLIIHCWAGISRSTAAAFVTACALAPSRDEAEIAQQLRAASPTASPNGRLVALADRRLSRQGRMVEAMSRIGRGAIAYEAEPFRLTLD